MIVHKSRSRPVSGRGAALPNLRYSEPPLWQGAALQPSVHTAHLWRAPPDLGFAAHLSALPFALTEATICAAHLPLALTAEAVPRPMIVLNAQGDGGPSPLIDQGRLLAGYLPAVLGLYPFFCQRHARTQALELAADMQGACILAEMAGTASAGWQPIFDDSGQLSPALQARKTALATWQNSRDAAINAARALASLGLLCHAPLIGPAWQSVDTDRLMQLDGAALARLSQSGALALAYALVIGAAHLPRLVQGMVQGRGSAAGSGAQTGTVPSRAAQDFMAAFAMASAAQPAALWPQETKE
jgi:hypothetical protein